MMRFSQRFAVSLGYGVPSIISCRGPGRRTVGRRLVLLAVDAEIVMMRTLATVSPGSLSAQ